MRATIFALALIFGAAVAPAEPLQTTPLSIEAIAQLPAVEGLVLSPDGKHLAGLVGTPKYKWPVISIWDVDNLAKPPVWIPSTNMRPVAVTFLGNERLMFFADQPLTMDGVKSKTSQAFVTDLEGKSFQQPFATRGTTAAPRRRRRCRPATHW